LKYCHLIHEITDTGSIFILYAFSLSSATTLCCSSSSSNSLPSLSNTSLTLLHKIFQRLTISLNILNSLSNIKQILNLLNPEIKLKIQFMKYLIQMKQSMIQFFLKQSETIGGDSDHHGSGDSSEQHEYLKDAMKYCNLLVENLLNYSKYYNSNEYILSNIYYCYVLSFFDSDLALKRIEQLFLILRRSPTSSSSTTGTSPSLDQHQNIQWITELTLMKIIILHKEVSQNHRQEMFIQLKIEMSECLKRSQDEYLPVVLATLSMMNLGD
jgi:hypothetical protein